MSSSQKSHLFHVFVSLLLVDENVMRFHHSFVILNYFIFIYRLVFISENFWKMTEGVMKIALAKCRALSHSVALWYLFLPFDKNGTSVFVHWKYLLAQQKVYYSTAESRPLELHSYPSLVKFVQNYSALLFVACYWSFVKFLVRLSPALLSTLMFE